MLLAVSSSLLTLRDLLAHLLSHFVLKLCPLRRSDLCTQRCCLLRLAIQAPNFGTQSLSQRNRSQMGLRVLLVWLPCHQAASAVPFCLVNTSSRRDFGTIGFLVSGSPRALARLLPQARLLLPALTVRFRFLVFCDGFLFLEFRFWASSSSSAAGSSPKPKFKSNLVGFIYSVGTGHSVEFN
jgi:hypothetical protein